MKKYLPTKLLPAHLVPAFREVRVAYIEGGGSISWLCSSIAKTFYNRPKEARECDEFVKQALKEHTFLISYARAVDPNLFLDSGEARRQLRIDWLNQLLEPYDEQI